VKLKLDENLPSTLVADLVADGHDLDAVAGEGLQGRPDEEVWEATQSAERFLITQELDFSDVRKFLPGSHHGILLVRLRVPGQRALADRVRQAFADEVIGSWHVCFVVVTDRKLRVRWPALDGPEERTV